MRKLSSILTFLANETHECKEKLSLVRHLCCEIFCVHRISFVLKSGTKKKTLEQFSTFNFYWYFNQWKCAFKEIDMSSAIYLQPELDMQILVRTLRLRLIEQRWQIVTDGNSHWMHITKCILSFYKGIQCWMCI